MGDVFAGGPSFREWLSHWTSEARLWSRLEARLEPQRLAFASEKVVQLLGDRLPRTPRLYHLEETARRLAAAWKQHRSLAKVEKWHLRRSPWVLFFPRSEPGKWLARNNEFMRAWLRWWMGFPRASSVVALLREFLSAYPTSLPAFDHIRLGLRRRLAVGNCPSLVRWRERCKRFGLLARDGPVRFVANWWKFGGSSMST